MWSDASANKNWNALQVPTASAFCPPTIVGWPIKWGGDLEKLIDDNVELIPASEKEAQLQLKIAVESNIQAERKDTEKQLK